MSGLSKAGQFVADRWVSWAMELTVLCVVAFFTIYEARKTNEQTREMLARYDAAITRYATDKTQALDSAVATGIQAAKEKARSVTVEDFKRLGDALRDE